MSKNLLVTCGSCPHIIEFMIPTLKEAKRQGWTIHGAYSDRAVKTMMLMSRLFSGLYRYTGWWEGRNMSVPLADKIFGWAKPDAVLIDLSGCGLAGGCWIEESYHRGMTAVELQGPSVRVWYYGKRSREATAKYIEVLKSVGYGGIPQGCMAGTPAQQFVGFTIGDQLLQRFDPGLTRSLLGLDRDQRIVTLFGTWDKDFYGQMCSEDLVEWNEMAKARDMRLVFSIHPAMRTSQGLPRVTFPPDVVLTSNAPCMLWGQLAQLAPVIDVLRASEFLIFQFGNALVKIGTATHVPMWLRRAGGARGNSSSRVARDTEECEREEEVCHKPGSKEPCHMPRTQRIFACWRTAEHLEQLFDGTLGCKGSEAEWKAWAEQRPARLDGHAAERIVDLLIDE